MKFRIGTRTNEEEFKAYSDSKSFETVYVIIEAETAEEAIIKAKTEYDVVLEWSVISIEEYEKQIKQREERKEKIKIQKEKEKARRKERESQPGYKAKREWNKANRELKKIEEQIAELNRKKAYYEKKKIEMAKLYKAETNEEIQ